MSAMAAGRQGQGMRRGSLPLGSESKRRGGEGSDPPSSLHTSQSLTHAVTQWARNQGY
jgi:hypothetical protein